MNFVNLAGPLPGSRGARMGRARDARQEQGSRNALRNPYASMFGGNQMPFGFPQWGPQGGGQGRGFSGGGMYGNALMSYLPMLQQSLSMPAPSRGNRPDGPGGRPARDQQQPEGGVRQIGNGPAVAIPHGDGSYRPHMPFWGGF